jgi:hypothetical protein
LGTESEPVGWFITCLPTCIKIDSAQETLDEKLVSLYYHYISSGMEHVSPRVRVCAATAVSFLSPFLKDEQVAPLIPALRLFTSPAETVSGISAWASFLHRREIGAVAVECLEKLLLNETGVSSESVLEVGKRLEHAPELSGTVALALTRQSYSVRDRAFGRDERRLSDKIGHLWDCRSVIRTLLGKFDQLTPNSDPEKAAVEILAFSLSRIGPHASVPANILPWYLPRMIRLSKDADPRSLEASDLRTILMAALKSEEGVDAAMAEAALPALRAVLEAEVSYEKIGALFKEELLRWRSTFSSAAEILKSENAEIYADSPIPSLLI